MIAYATDPTQDLNLAISDSAGNAYQQAGTGISAGNVRTYIFAAYNVNALPSGSAITINQTVYSSTAVAARAAVVSVFAAWPRRVRSSRPATEMARAAQRHPPGRPRPSSPCSC